VAVEAGSSGGGLESWSAISPLSPTNTPLRPTPNPPHTPAPAADWTVKLWDTSHPRGPVYSFDLGSPVGDVSWAPYSSTTFAAVTDDGRAHVFDLSVDHHGPLCEQKVVKKAKATRLAFNRRHPHVLLVGDSAGAVTSLKLSPNLRRVTPIVPASGAAAAKKVRRGSGGGSSSAVDSARLVCHAPTRPAVVDSLPHLSLDRRVRRRRHRPRARRWRSASWTRCWR
jgi:WD40 repeat protein